MAKRLTKAQREERDYEAFTQRIRDIFIGATCGNAVDEDHFLGPDEMSRAMQAVKEAWSLRPEATVISIWHLEHWFSLDQAVEFLWEQGLRADGSAPRRMRKDEEVDGG